MKSKTSNLTKIILHTAIVTSVLLGAPISNQCASSRKTVQVPPNLFQTESQDGDIYEHLFLAVNQARSLGYGKIITPLSINITKDFDKDGFQDTYFITDKNVVIHDSPGRVYYGFDSLELKTWQVEPVSIYKGELHGQR